MSQWAQATGTSIRSPKAEATAQHSTVPACVADRCPHGPWRARRARRAMRRLSLPRRISRACGLPIGKHACMHAIAMPLSVCHPLRLSRGRRRRTRSHSFLWWIELAHPAWACSSPLNHWMNPHVLFLGHRGKRRLPNNSAATFSGSVRLQHLHARHIVFCTPMHCAATESRCVYLLVYCCIRSMRAHTHFGSWLLQIWLPCVPHHHAIAMCAGRSRAHIMRLSILQWPPYPYAQNTKPKKQNK